MSTLELLVHWDSQTAKEATWKEDAQLQQVYPEFELGRGVILLYFNKRNKIRKSIL